MHLAHKAEDAVNMETGSIVAVTIQLLMGATRQRIIGTVAETVGGSRVRRWKPITK